MLSFKTKKVSKMTPHGTGIGILWDSQGPGSSRVKTCVFIIKYSMKYAYSDMGTLVITCTEIAITASEPL